MVTQSESPASRPHKGSVLPQTLTTRGILVWAGAVLIYMVAIINRTSFGVAGTEAIDTFHVNASQLAVFTSVQVGVYALSQIPVGLCTDRFGPRNVLLAGALIMALGQIILGITTSFPVAIGARVLIGAGDATAFISVLRLLPLWIPLRLTPLFTQLTSGIGQIGQFVSAVPFLALLHITGWRPAFIAVGVSGAAVALAAGLVISAKPAAVRDAVIQRSSPRSALASVVRNPVCWQGFFIHWSVLCPQVNFTLMWGVPLMTMGMGLSAHTAGLVLVINTVFSVVAGPLIGAVSARAGSRRQMVAIYLSVVVSAVWLLFFWGSARSFAWIAVVNILMALLTPAANFGFDTIRERVDHSVLTTATGLANMGGFTACMIAAQSVGFLLDAHAGGHSYAWADFRFAWIAPGVVWLVGVAGFFLARKCEKAVPLST